MDKKQNMNERCACCGVWLPEDGLCSRACERAYRAAEQKLRNIPPVIEPLREEDKVDYEGYRISHEAELYYIEG